jgi:hypothetical protein
MSVRPLILILSLSLPASIVFAQPQHAPPAKKKPSADRKTEGPKAIGRFDDWVAAIHQEAGQPVCYAFTPARTSTPEVKNRGRVVLTVTQRPGLRDAVAIEAGFTYPTDAAVTVKADQTQLEFYTAQRNAFARDGHAAAAALDRASRAVAVSPGPRETKVTDTFSLKGFAAAYAAIVKKCPPR